MLCYGIFLYTVRQQITIIGKQYICTTVVRDICI